MVEGSEERPTSKKETERTPPRPDWGKEVPQTTAGKMPQLPEGSPADKVLPSLDLGKDVPQAATGKTTDIPAGKSSEQQLPLPDWSKEGPGTAAAGKRTQLPEEGKPPRPDRVPDERVAGRPRQGQDDTASYHSVNQALGKVVQDNIKSREGTLGLGGGMDSEAAAREVADKMTPDMAESYMRGRELEKAGKSLTDGSLPENERKDLWHYKELHGALKEEDGTFAGKKTVLASFEDQIQAKVSKSGEAYGKPEAVWNDKGATGQGRTAGQELLELDKRKREATPEAAGWEWGKPVPTEPGARDSGGKILPPGGKSSEAEARGNLASGKPERETGGGKPAWLVPGQESNPLFGPGNAPDRRRLDGSEGGKPVRAEDERVRVDRAASGQDRAVTFASGSAERDAAGRAMDLRDRDVVSRNQGSADRDAAPRTQAPGDRQAGPRGSGSAEREAPADRVTDSSGRRWQQVPAQTQGDAAAAGRTARPEAGSVDRGGRESGRRAGDESRTPAATERPARPGGAGASSESQPSRGQGYAKEAVSSDGGGRRQRTKEGSSGGDSGSRRRSEDVSRGPARASQAEGASSTATEGGSDRAGRRRGREVEGGSSTAGSEERRTRREAADRTAAPEDRRARREAADRPASPEQGAVTQPRPEKSAETLKAISQEIMSVARKPPPGKEASQTSGAAADSGARTTEVRLAGQRARAEAVAAEPDATAAARRGREPAGEAKPAPGQSRTTSGDATGSSAARRDSPAAAERSEAGRRDAGGDAALPPSWSSGRVVPARPAGEAAAATRPGGAGDARAAGAAASQGADGRKVQQSSASGDGTIRTPSVPAVGQAGSLSGALREPRPGGAAGNITDKRYITGTEIALAAAIAAAGVSRVRPDSAGGSGKDQPAMSRPLDARTGGEKPAGTAAGDGRAAASRAAGLGDKAQGSGQRSGSGDAREGYLSAVQKGFGSSDAAGGKSLTVTGVRPFFPEDLPPQKRFIPGTEIALAAVLAAAGARRIQPELSGGGPDSLLSRVLKGSAQDSQSQPASDRPVPRGDDDAAGGRPGELWRWGTLDSAAGDDEPAAVDAPRPAPRFSAPEAVADAGGAAPPDMVSEGEARPPSRKFPVLQRPTTLISSRDTLVSIAETFFHDPNLGWLIADLNAESITESWIDGKRVVEVRSRQKLWLPVWEDIVAFYNDRPADAGPENLVTIVEESQVNVELLNSTLGGVLGTGSAGNLPFGGFEPKPKEGEA